MTKKTLRIGIMDADLLERKNHRFPNLACEKIAGYYKDAKKAEVTLLFDYDSFDLFDKIFISKVFTNTPIPSWLVQFVNGDYPGDIYIADSPKWLNSKKQPEINLGGTGFFFDKAPELDPEIEHHMPYYHLYDEWIMADIENARTTALSMGKVFNEASYKVQYKEYLEYSIGFVTRGCFRKCGFCVNQKYDHVFAWSALNEFYDPKRKKICLLDDNFLGYPEWKSVLQEILATGKQFKFKQGLDERLLTEEKCELLFTSKYDGDLTFAFDKVSDYKLIHSKLKMIRKHNPTKGVMFYVLVGFEGCGAKDIENAFKRIELLFNYRCIPYIMRYISKDNAPWKKSPYRSMYVTLARWCNQPRFVKKMTFREFCVANQNYHKNKDTLCAAYAAMLDFEKKYPRIAERYFDMRFGEHNPKIEG